MIRGGYGVEESQRQQLYSLFQELINSKFSQRQREEALVEALNKPLYRKWVHERVLDQHKHERILQDIVVEYLSEKVTRMDEDKKIPVNHSMLQEVNKRLEDVGENIQVISTLSQPIQDFKIYKMLQGMLSDEYIYQNRLMRMLLEK